MEQKTKINAEEGKQEMLITREFDLPLELLFKAYIEPGIVEQWMGTKVLKLENKRHGGWQFETTDPQGNKHGFSGVFHEFEPERRITRTFEMENTGFGVQLEFLEFEKISEERSKLTMHVLYRSTEERDKYLQIGMTRGMDLAHNRLEKVVNKLFNK